MSDHPLRIRPEQPEDRAAVRRVNEAAFGQPDEADLVDAIREAAAPLVSLVAVSDSDVIGHILFSPVTLTPPSDLSAMGLAPMAVLPKHQHRGVGTALVEAGLSACTALDVDAVFVLGHPTYYPRFGFVPASLHGFRCTYPAPDEAFMVRALYPERLADLSGTVHYHPAFG